MFGIVGKRDLEGKKRGKKRDLEIETNYNYENQSAWFGKIRDGSALDFTNGGSADVGSREEGHS